jgi:Ca2+-binding RTX toxin-like protein
VFINGVLTDLMTSIENVIAGDGGSTFNGNGFDNMLVGGAGDDLLFGNGGNDTFVGGGHVLGSFNQLFGGLGTDTADYSAETRKVFVDLRAPAGHIDTGAGFVLNDLMNSIENVLGGSNDDILVGTDSDNNVLNGGAGTDLLFGFGGNDTLIGGTANVGQYNQLWGGTGLDTASYSYATTRVYADLNVLAGWVTNGGLVLTDVYNSIENLTGGAVADSLVGDTGANVITGGAGADILYANTGVSSDASADTFVYSAIADSNLTNGYDTIVNFQTGQDHIDFTAFHILATDVTIVSGGGSTSIYANVDGIAGNDIAISLIGNNAAVIGDFLL